MQTQVKELETFLNKRNSGNLESLRLDLGKYELKKHTGNIPEVYALEGGETC